MAELQENCSDYRMRVATSFLLALTLVVTGCSKDAEAVKRDESPGAESTPSDPQKILRRAIATGDLPTVKEVIGANPALIHAANGQMPPLLTSILRNKPDIAQFLIEAGADVSVADSSERTAVHLAVERNLPGLIPLLAENGAPLSEWDRVGWTPLHWAAAQDKLPVARALLEAGANIHKRTIRGGTVLHEAASTGGPEMVELFLELGVDPTVVASDGGTALEVARHFKNDEAIAILERAPTATPIPSSSTAKPTTAESPQSP